MVEDNVLDTRRSFIGPDEMSEYFIGSPTAEDIRGADWQYSKQYTRCLNENIPTSAELMDILRKRGIVGQDFDIRAEELGTILNELILRLSEATNDMEKSDLAMQVAKARENLFQWNQRLSGPMANTCEQISDDSRLEYITACIVQDASGARIWNSYQDFLSYKDQALILKARYEVMLYLQGYESDFLNKTPEAIAMREVQDHISEEISKQLEEEAAENAVTPETDTSVDEGSDTVSTDDLPVKKPVARKSRTTRKPKVTKEVTEE